jgi:hypothetical protein
LIDVVNMRANAWLGEVQRMSDAPDDEVEVQRRLEEIQRRKRGRIRWSMTPHTAELALTALHEPVGEPRQSGKRRRRKRHKRLL